MSNVATRATRRKLTNLTAEQLGKKIAVWNQNEKFRFPITVGEIIDMLKAGMSRTPKSANYNSAKGSIQETLTVRMIELTGVDTDYVRDSSINKMFDLDELVGRKTHTSEKAVRTATSTPRVGGGRRAKSIEWSDDTTETVTEAEASTPIDITDDVEVEAPIDITKTVNPANTTSSIWD